MSLKIIREGENQGSQQSGFLLPENHAIVRKHKATFEAFEKSDMEGFGIMMDPGVVVIHNDHEMIFEIIAAAQHCPSVLPRVLLKLEFVFGDDEGNVLPDDEQNEWLNKAEFKMWIHELFISIPQIIFFFSDKTMRYNSMMGYVKDGDFETKRCTKKSILGFLYPPDIAYKLDEESSRACQYFYDYCMVAGIDPKPFLEKVIKEMSFNISYNKVKQLYDAMKAQGGKVDYVFPLQDGTDKENKKDDSPININSKKEPVYNFKRVDLHKKDRYYLPKGHFAIKEMNNMLNGLDGTKSLFMRLAVPMSFIEEKNCTEIIKMISVFQHYPNAVKSAVFNLSFYLREDKNEKREFAPMEEEFIVIPECREFLHHINTLIKGYFFFLSNPEYRLYAIIGNMVEEDKSGLIANTEGILKKKFTAPQVVAMMKEAKISCKYFMEYCNTSGEDSEPYITKMISEMNFDFSYQDVKNDYDRMVKAGYNIDGFTLSVSKN